MERISDLLRGFSRVQITGPEPSQVLNSLAELGIEFWNIRLLDEFTLIMSLPFEGEKALPEITKKCYCEWNSVSKRGMPIFLRKARLRHVLWFLPIVLLLLYMFSTLFVWEIEISGNENVSETEIRNALEDSGVYIGSYHPSFVSDMIRSRVLSLVPELKWISISVFGSRVRADVRERTEIPKVPDIAEAVKLIAEQPGIISSISVLRGYGIMEKGQAVMDGETLVSGAVPSTFGSTLLLHASGRVYARTFYEITAVVPTEYTEKRYTGRSKTKYAVIFGRKRINFYRNCGITEPMCDNMIHEQVLGIPGIFELPITLVSQKSEQFETVSVELAEDEAQAILETRLIYELDERIDKDGKTVFSEITHSMRDGYYIATLRAECLEDIAVEEEMTQEEINSALAEEEEKSTP